MLLLETSWPEAIFGIVAMIVFAAVVITALIVTNQKEDKK